MTVLPNSPVLEALGLTVRLAGADVVRGVDLRFYASTWHGVLGPNGSGKTTLLRALAGRGSMHAGRIWVGGEDVTTALDRRAEYVGFAPEPSSLPAELTAAELISLVAEARRAPAGEPVDVQRALDLARLGPIRIGSMSAGMRQRVALGLAFLGRPAIVLLDEPFNWLDPVAAYDLKLALRVEVEAGVSLVTSLHDVGTLLHHCDTGLVMQDGTVIQHLDSADLRDGSKDLLSFERRMREVFAG